MTAEIIPLEKRQNLKRYANGETMFLHCPRCEESSFAPVVAFDQHGPLLRSLVCISEKCDGNTEILIKYGRPFAMQDSDVITVD